MARDNISTQNATSRPAVGNALIVSGTVQAQSYDGAMRILQLSSQTFARESIITDSNGMISIVFCDTANTQLDLGRMSDILIDQDVFQGEVAHDLGEAAAEVAEIQEALIAGNFDPTTELQEQDVIHSEVFKTYIRNSRGRGLTTKCSALYLHKRAPPSYFMGR